MKALRPAVGIFLLLVPEADQGVGAETDPFPAQVEQRQILGQHQQQHGGDKQVEQGEIADMAGIIRHVGDGVEMDQAADKGDHQAERQGERIEIEGERRLKSKADSQEAISTADRAGVGAKGGKGRGKSSPR